MLTPFAFNWVAHRPGQTWATVFLLLLASVLKKCEAAPVSNSTKDTLCPADTDVTCNNFTTYNAIDRGFVHFVELKVNITSHQLKTNVGSTLDNFNYQYPEGSIEFHATIDNSTENVDVCRIIGKKLSSYVPDPQSGLKCPWDYKCDYDPRRIPQVMWQAECSQHSTWQCSCSDEEEGCAECIPINRKCEPVYYPVPILYSDQCYPLSQPGKWEWKNIKVAVACTSSNEIAF